MDDKQEGAWHDEVIRSHGPPSLEHNESRHLQVKEANIKNISRLKNSWFSIKAEVGTSVQI